MPQKLADSIDPVSAQEAIRSMQRLDTEVRDFIREKLRLMQAELSTLPHKSHANKRLHADARRRAGEP